MNYGDRSPFPTQERTFATLLLETNCSRLKDPRTVRKSRGARPGAVKGAPIYLIAFVEQGNRLRLVPPPDDRRAFAKPEGPPERPKGGRTETGVHDVLNLQKWAQCLGTVICV